MHPMDIARKLRHLVFDASTGRYNDKLDISVCETMLMAACALEEQSVDLDAERYKRHADNAFLEEACKAALHDLKKVVTSHMLCDCCKHIMPDGECDSPCEHEANCWTWRGVCNDNDEKLMYGNCSYCKHYDAPCHEEPCRSCCHFVIHSKISHWERRDEDAH